MENDQGNSAQASDLHQQMPKTPLQMAREDHERRPVEKDQRDPSNPRDKEEEVEMDRAHTEEAKELHHSAILTVEPTGKKEKRTAQKHLEEGQPGRDG